MSDLTDQLIQSAIASDQPVFIDDRDYVNNAKVYVDVDAHFTKDGRLLPTAIYWEDGRRYPIDRVTDMRWRASLKAGGTGLRYTCIVSGRPSYLFFEEDKWFVERRTG